MISDATSHSILSLPINCPFQDLKGFKLKSLQDHLDEIILIIIDEISMMGKKMIHQIDKRLEKFQKHSADLLFLLLVISENFLQLQKRKFVNQIIHQVPWPMTHFKMLSAGMRAIVMMVRTTKIDIFRKYWPGVKQEL